MSKAHDFSKKPGHLLGRLGDFAVLAHWASGGMAEIYLARQIGIRGFDKLVALKVMRSEFADESDFRAMFFDEARVSALLTHPNIVQTYDVGEVQGQVYMAMEFVSGETLTKVCRDERAPRAIAVNVVRRVALALHYAHTREDLEGRPLHLVHRDISPSNILVGYDGVVKLLDFGIAKAAANSIHTQAGVVKGKLSYMSPEHILGEELDGRSDLFSLGLVLWKALVGRAAVVRRFESKEQFLRDVRGELIEAPSVVGGDSDEALDAIVLKACAADRNARYESAGELAADLQRYLMKVYPGIDVQDETRALMHERFGEREAHLKEIVSLTTDVASEVRRLKEFETSGDGVIPPDLESGSFRNRNSASVYPPSYSGQQPTLASASEATRRSPSRAPPPLPRRRVRKAGVVVAATLLAFGVWLGLSPAERALEVVTTPPGAEVWVDGKPVGKTPLTLDVATEPLDLALRLQGYSEHRTSLKAGSSSAQVQAALVELDELGTLVVEAEPSTAEIRLGELPPRPSPALFEGLPQGEVQRVVVSAPGYESVTRLVEVNDTQEPLRVALELNGGAFVLASCAGIECELFVNGRSLGAAPGQKIGVPAEQELSLELRSGKRILMAKRETPSAGELIRLTYEKPPPRSQRGSRSGRSSNGRAIFRESDIFKKR